VLRIVRNQRQSDRLQDAFRIPIDLRVVKAQDAVTQLIQRSVSRFVVLAMSVEPVLHAINLHDQASSTALEIDNVVRYRRLAAKMKSQLS